MTRYAALILLIPAMQADDLDVRVQKLNERLVAAFVELAGDYDTKKEPEACHFFAECAIGLGPKDEKTVALRKKWEDEVYYGRSRGGVPIAQKELAALDAHLGALAKEARTILDALVEEAQKGKIKDEQRSRLQRIALRCELARGAGEYIQATQRFNATRSKMKLRAILWDFDSSSRLIVASWHMSETADWTPEQKSAEDAWSFSASVPWAKENANRLPTWDYNKLKIALPDVVDEIRPLAVVREHLLNPDARRLWLGHWGKGRKLQSIKLYAIPRGEYRRDIATPTSRFRGETIAEDRDRWTDVEETIQVGTSKVAVAQYPFDGEPDAPTTFGGGERTELNWSDPTIDQKGLFTMGLPIMLRFFGGEKITDLDFDVKAKGGRALSCRKYLNGDKRVDMENLPTVLLLPEKPFDKGATYQVRIKGKLDGTPFERKWEFATGK